MDYLNKEELDIEIEDNISNDIVQNILLDMADMPDDLEWFDIEE